MVPRVGVRRGTGTFPRSAMMLHSPSVRDGACLFVNGALVGVNYFSCYM